MQICFCYVDLLCRQEGILPIKPDNKTFQPNQFVPLLSDFNNVNTATSSSKNTNFKFSRNFLQSQLTSFLE